ncbi:hypothetical protein ACFWFZ_30060 [Streptomyces sp. NPDC060232]
MAHTNNNGVRAGAAIVASALAVAATVWGVATLVEPGSAGAAARPPGP